MKRVPRILLCAHVALLGCVLPPDRHARLAEAGVTEDAAPPTDADAPGPGDDARRPPEGDAVFADARSGDARAAQDGGPVRDASTKPDGSGVSDTGTHADARASADAATHGDAGRPDGSVMPDAGPPARFRVEGRLVPGAGASTGDRHRIVGRLATGETRAFGMNYGIEGGLRISCNQEATCIETAE